MAKKLGKGRIVQTGLRISAELRNRLDRAAKHDGLSLNSEMEMRLEASFRLAQDNEQLTVLVRIMVDNTKRLEDEVDELEARIDPVKAQEKKAEKEKAVRAAYEDHVKDERHSK